MYYTAILGVYMFDCSTLSVGRSVQRMHWHKCIETLAIQRHSTGGPPSCRPQMHHPRLSSATHTHTLIETCQCQCTAPKRIKHTIDTLHACACRAVFAHGYICRLCCARCVCVWCERVDLKRVCLCVFAWVRMGFMA